MQDLYSFNNLKILLFYVIIPLTTILILFLIISKIYESGRKNKDKNQTNYVLNYWSITMCIIFVAILLSTSVGFAAAFTRTLREFNIVEENKFLYYFFMFFPIFPFSFLIIYIRKYLKNIKNKEMIEEGE